MKKILVSLSVLGYMLTVVAGTLPSKPWIELHVIPVVEVSNPKSCQNSTITGLDKEWYLLLSRDVARQQLWDALVINKSEVQPMQIFGIATIKSALDRKTDFFMKTVFNTLELMTQDNSWYLQQLIRGRNSLYTRKDYMYYYQPSYVIPPVYVNDKNQCYVFVKLLGKKPQDWLDAGVGRGVLGSRVYSRTWSNAYKSEFTWISMKDLQAVVVKEGVDQVAVKNRSLASNLVTAIQQYWGSAVSELIKLDDQYQKNFDRQRVMVYETDLNERLAKQAGESWFVLKDAIYFNDTTPVYGAFGLYNTEARIQMDNVTYNSLQDFRVAELATESLGSIQKDEDLKEVYRGLKTKIAKNPALQARLANTGIRPLVYASKKDRLYGIGADGRGENHLGRMLMLIRKNPAAQYTGDRAIELEQGIYPRLSLGQSTYNALLYRALGKLPALPPERAKEEPPIFYSGGGEEEFEIEKLKYQSDFPIKRRIVKLTPEEQAEELAQQAQSAPSQQSASSSQQSASAGSKERETPQQMKERLMQEVLQRPENPSGVSPETKKNQ